MTQRPRSPFRSRARSAPEVISLELRGDVLHLGRQPLPSVQAWVESHRATFRPGTLTEVEVRHDADCTYPATGGECTCIMGPEIKIMGNDPRDN